MSAPLMRLQVSLLTAIGLTGCGPVVVEDTDREGSSDSGIETTAGEIDTDTGESGEACRPDAALSEAVYCLEAELGREDCPVCGPQGAGCENAVLSMVSEPCGPEYDADVSCGPFVSGNAACCYVAAVTEVGFGGCDGRPFMAHGVPRVAPVTTRRDWATDPGLRAAADAREGARWEQRALDEHASIAAFARFVMELLEVGAPAWLLSEAVAAMKDEIAHAQLAFGVVSHYLGRPLGPGPLPTHDVAAARTLEEIACATLIEGAIGETRAAATAAQEAAVEGDSALRKVLETVASDEARHAALAWRFLRWAVQRQPSLRAALAGRFEQALADDGSEVARLLLRPSWNHALGDARVHGQARA